MSIFEATRSFAYTKWVSRSALKRERFQQVQMRLLNSWLARALTRVEAFKDFNEQLCDLPIMDKSCLMENFSSYNVGKVTDDQVREAMCGDFSLGKFKVGASTGTSGNRGLFVISEWERFRWLGAIVAKTISDLLWRRQRIAIILPQGSALYNAANQFRQIDLRVFDLTLGPESWRKALENFNPTVIVAPPKVLRQFAEASFSLSPIRIFAGAETLDALDQPLIEERFGVPLRQIYMATEGLLGVSCQQGKIHLAEDSIFFEYEAVGKNLANPIITSFRRETQILARYRMNDLLRLSEQQCACGSPLQTLEEVVGRIDDCFRVNSPSGEVLLTPDILRNTVVDSDHRINDFRIIQTHSDKVELILKPEVSRVSADAVKHSLEKLFMQRQVQCRVELKQCALSPPTSRKLRRVECCLSGRLAS